MGRLKILHKSRMDGFRVGDHFKKEGSIKKVDITLLLTSLSHLILKLQ